MRLAIIGWIKTVEWLQWYDVQAEPGGVLDSEGHQRGSVECLSVLEGEFEVEVSDVQRAKAGETLLPVRPPPYGPLRRRCTRTRPHGLYPQGGRDGLRAPCRHLILGRSERHHPWVERDPSGSRAGKGA